MPEHRVGTQQEWQAEREQLLAEEKELTRRSDELARKRQALPWVPVEGATASRPRSASSPWLICSTATPSC